MVAWVHCFSSNIIVYIGKSLFVGRHSCSELFADILFPIRHNLFKDRKEMKEKYRKLLAVLDYASTYTELYWRNDENRIGGALRCFDNFSNTLGESSKVILN
jgi:hypothetical protein